MKRSDTLSPAGQPARSTRLILLVAVIALAVVALGAWVYANQGLGMLWVYSALITALVGFVWFAPYARTCGHPGEGTIAVWLALILGPLSLIVLVPWMTGLAVRFEAEQGT